MSHSLDVESSSRHPSLVSETSSIASSDLPNTASEHFRRSPSPWRAAFINTDNEKDHPERNLPVRFAKNLFRLGGSSQHQQQHGFATPANIDELKEHTLRRPATDAGRTNTRLNTTTREEDQALSSCPRQSGASVISASPIESKHSSLGPLPFFPRPPGHTLSRHSSLASTRAKHRPNLFSSDHGHTGTATASHEERSELGRSTPVERPSAPTPSRSNTPVSYKKAKARPTLASFFQAASRKALRRDDFRKDSFSGRQELERQESTPSQSVSSTPLRRRFLGLRSSTPADTRRSAKTPPPPPTPAPPPVPVISLPTTFIGKENITPPSPIIKRKRSSLPTSSRRHMDAQEDDAEMDEIVGLPISPASHHGHGHHEQDLNQLTLRRSKSDSKHGKRSHSPGQTTSIRVPGAPLPVHPHPHPYFSCDGPPDRGLLSLPSFSFERPRTRPSTPGQSQEFLPLHKIRKNKLRDDDADSEMNAEIRSVLAAGTEARRERRAPSGERLRVIGGMHRQNLPDITGGDDQLSPDPERFSQPIPVPHSTHGKSHLSHAMFAFESPAGTPLGSRVDLVLTPLTPPPTMSRRSAQAQPAPSSSYTPLTPPPSGTVRSHHRHFSSSATAVAPPLPPKDTRYAMPSDKEMGIIKQSPSPKLYAGNAPVHHDRGMGSTSSSSHDKHRRGYSLNQNLVGFGKQRKDSAESSREGATSPTSYRHQHLHSQSLSGSTVQSHYPTPTQSPAIFGPVLYQEINPLTREERYYDLREAMKLSIGDSRYKSFERAIRRYNEHTITLQGQGGLFERVQRILNEAVDDGLPKQTARKYFQTLQAILTTG